MLFEYSIEILVPVRKSAFHIYIEMSIRSEEVNYLIYRYLQESGRSCFWYQLIIGFEHTAYAFAYESMVADTKVYDEYLPPGSLVTYLQKALQYIELETHIRDVQVLKSLCNCLGWFRSGL